MFPQVDANGRRGYSNGSSEQELRLFAGELPGMPDCHTANLEIRKQFDGLKVCCSFWS